MTLFFPIPLASRLTAPTVFPLTGALWTKVVRFYRRGDAIGSFAALVDISLGVTTPKRELRLCGSKETRCPLTPAQSALLSTLPLRFTRSGQ